MTKRSGPVRGNSLAGQTLRWKFDEGPTAGTVFEHTFRPDGTVVWRDVGEKTKGPGPTYASFQVAPETHLVSYRAESGYTLTVALNLGTKKCWGIASNEKEWYPLTGSLATIR